MRPGTDKDSVVSVVGRKHANLVYNAQTLRHIAEQIDALYRDSTEGFEGTLARDEEVLRRGVDLTDPEYVMICLIGNWS